VLQLNGYTTLESTSAEDGLRIATEHHPALIVMDIHLPGMSGIEALKSLRADRKTRSTPVIAVTASVMSQQQAEVVSAGFDALERKPISVAGLLNTVRRLLDRHPISPASP